MGIKVLQDNKPPGVSKVVCTMMYMMELIVYTPKTFIFGFQNNFNYNNPQK